MKIIQKHVVVDLFNALMLLKNTSTSLWYFVYKNIKELTPIVKDIEETRRVIIEKTGGIFNTESGHYEYPEGKQEEATKLINELMAETVSVNITVAELTAEVEKEKHDVNIMGFLLDNDIITIK